MEGEDGLKYIYNSPFLPDGTVECRSFTVHQQQYFMVLNLLIRTFDVLASGAQICASRGQLESAGRLAPIDQVILGIHLGRIDQINAKNLPKLCTKFLYLTLENSIRRMKRDFPEKLSSRLGWWIVRKRRAPCHRRLTYLSFQVVPFFGWLVA